MSIQDETDAANTPPVAQITLRCPTCGAGQPLASECRRCKCDLSLVVAVLRQTDQLARHCCRLLRDERFADAEVTARRLAELDPNENALRYLAISRLMRRRYQSAIDLLDEITCGSDSIANPASFPKP